MLIQLNITNYAIIDALEVRFDKGLNIITGETGAGKSIVLGALSLVLGDRVDSTMIVHTDKKTVIEALFQIKKNLVVQNFLSQKGYDEVTESDYLIIRREINPKTKISRAFINDTPVTLSELSELSALLIDLHQQFDTFKIDNYAFQIYVLDTLAENQTLFTRYKEKYTVYDTLKKEFESLKFLYEKDKKESDYLAFINDELEKANLKPNELENLEEELKVSSHTIGLETLIKEALSFLQENEKPVLSEMRNLVKRFQYYGAIKKELQKIGERLASIQIEMTDITADISRIQGTLSVDEKRIQWITDRINEGFRLLKKHGVKTTEALLKIQKKAAADLENFTNMESVLEEKNTALRNAFQEAKFIADELSFQRKKCAKQVESDIIELLAQVGMPNARIQIKITPQAHLNEFGLDNVAFLIDTNRNLNFEPIGKIASGGELSRVMLIIKSLVAQNLALPTLVFDEIDTGVSGEVAKQIGLILEKLALSIQVICITHQPTIAAKGSRHFYIYKEEKHGKISTQIQKLTPKERVLHIAQMLGGDNPSEQMLTIAKELLHME